VQAGGRDITASSFDPLFGAYGDSAREYYFDLQTNFLYYTDNTGTEEARLSWQPAAARATTSLSSRTTTDTSS
jgi:hypothetical protein